MPEYENIELEIRTKSTYSKLFSKNIIKNVIIAYSFTPDRFSNKYEKGVPSVDKRLKVIKRLSSLGGKLRFPDTIYKKLIKENMTESLFFNLEKKKNSYESSNENNIEDFLIENLTKFIDERKIFFNN